MAAGWDDDELVEALQQVLRSLQDAPQDVVQAGKSVYDLRDPDAELALLSYDSLAGAGAGAGPVGGLPAETASAHALTFSSAHLTVELEFTADAVLGQVVPPEFALIAIQLTDGTETALPVNETGCFSVHPAPAARFRLRCQNDGVRVLTEWITP